MSRDACEIDTPAPAWTAWAFAAATLLGAFLLFQIQPLVGKFILPWFGGVPAVWTTCMLFFQIVLFGGYAYSHLLVARFSPRSQAIAQAVLLLAALAVLPIAPGDSWKPADSAVPTARILWLLTATVGLPYFVLSTTSPLIQAWFSRSFPGRRPYRLYALSNIGSLAALLTYPFVFEPAFDLTTQARLWSWCFPVYVLLIGLCAAAVWHAGPLSLRERARVRADDSMQQPSPPAPLPSCWVQQAGEGSVVSPTWLRRALWVLLPACASLVLLATTNHVCQDVAPRPFLWVMPLSLYLLSFIVCFDHPRWYVRPVWALPALIGIAAVIAGDKMAGGQYRHEGASLTFAHELVLHFGTMFSICMLCHGELVRLKPEPQRLTGFYLSLAGGGALGGVLVGLVAPHLFRTFFEWNLGMLASYVMATLVLFLAVPKSGRWRLPAFLLGDFAVGGFIPVLLWQSDARPAGPDDSRLVDRQRNFYGVVSVWEADRNDPRKHRVRMEHGAIVHGEQFLWPAKRGQAFNYYAPQSGIALAIRELQERKQFVHVGVVGLGIGTLASFARPGDRFTFYEINPVVRDMAESHFYYLSDARDRGAEIEIVMGDGRLSLERQQPQDFDLLVLDAFNGDSVPVHLLTREAMGIYRRHVAPNAILAIHVTNSYLYLFPVVRALADDAHLDWRRVFVTKDEAASRMRSDWVILSDNESFLGAIPNAPPPNSKDDFAVPVWTDRNNSQFMILVGRR